MKRIRHLSRSPGDTRALAARLGACLAPGDVVALTGELGAGKTEFVRGLAEGLQVPPDAVASPSFALVHEYLGRVPLVHLDLYRLAEITPEFLPDLEDYLAGPHVTAVEWAERLGGLLPEEHVAVLLVITGAEERDITLTGHGPRGEELILHLRGVQGPTAPSLKIYPLPGAPHMARKKPRRRAPQEPEEILNLAQRGLNFLKPYLKWLITGGVTLALVFLGWSGYTYLKHSKEAKAQAALAQVRPQLSQPEQAAEAIKALDALIRDYPSTAAAQLARSFKAHLLYQTGKYTEATRTYEELRAALGSRDPYGWEGSWRKV